MKCYHDDKEVAENTDEQNKTLEKGADDAIVSGKIRRILFSVQVSRIDGSRWNVVVVQLGRRPIDVRQPPIGTIGSQRVLQGRQFIQRLVGHHHSADFPTDQLISPKI